MQRPGLVDNLVDDNTGVSPVIGVILMVAVTVIIAAVIGSSTLGLADGVSETPPKVQFEITEKENLIYDVEERPGSENKIPYAVIIEHTAGEEVDPGDLSVKIDGAEAHAYLSGGYDPYGNGHDGVGPAWYTHDTVSAGDQTMIATHTAETNYLEEGNVNFEPAVEENDRTVWQDWNNDQSKHLIRTDEGSEGDNVQNFGTDDGIHLQEGQELTVVWEGSSQSHVLLEHTVGGD